jgi:hypothetical protein
MKRNTTIKLIIDTVSDENIEEKALWLAFTVNVIIMAITNETRRFFVIYFLYSYPL